MNAETALVTPPYFAWMQAAAERLLTAPRQALLLEPAFYEKFACTGCGLCCQRAWNIPVSKAYYDQWYAHFDADARFRAPFVPTGEARDSHYADLRRKPGTSECIFLDPDNRCHIHATYGAGALPSGCGRYPRYEAWFGAFLGRFMYDSCPEVPLLSAAWPGLRARQITVAPQDWDTATPHPLGFGQGYLWLGLQLDLFADAALTPLQAFGCLLRLLGELPSPLSRTTPELLAALAARPRRPGYLPALLSPPYGQLVKLLGPQPQAQAFAAEIAAGRRPRPALTPFEIERLQSFLRSWLGWRILSQHLTDPASGEFFYPAYYLLSLQLALLQVLAFAEREQEGAELSPSHLLRAATVVGFHYQNRRELIEPLARLGREACLRATGEVLLKRK